MKSLTSYDAILGVTDVELEVHDVLCLHLQLQGQDVQQQGVVGRLRFLLLILQDLAFELSSAKLSLANTALLLFCPFQGQGLGRKEPVLLKQAKATSDRIAGKSPLYWSRGACQMQYTQPPPPAALPFLIFPYL